MITFEKYLEEKGVSENLSEALCALKDAIKLIADAIEVEHGGKVGTENVFGEEQIALDILSDKILVEKCKQTSSIGLVASEELPDQLKVGDGPYAACFDPLDGSSLADVNLAVGTIIGVYKTGDFIGVKGDDQVAAMIAVYGPRTTILLTLKEGVVEFLMDGEGKCLMTRENLNVGEGKMFAPGNLRACKFRKDYLDLVNYWINEQYTLRYSGGMVPDINQIIIKGKGIFTYPGYKDAPDGKLRILFECAPMALLMEQAGGAATDGSKRILEIEVTKLDQRTPILIGSKVEVQRAEEFLS